MRDAVLASILSLAICLALIACARDDDSSPREAKTLTVFAAASTTNVIRNVARQFEQQTGIDMTLSFNASSTLARQIEAGAPADIYLSGNRQWMDHLEEAGVIVAETRQGLLANDLVLIAPRDGTFEIELAPEFDFRSRLPDVKRIAIGDPSHVPAGQYARQALQTLGWWESLEPMIIPALDVRAALRLVERGEVDAGIVYATEVKDSTTVARIATFPAHLHDAIHYPVALCRDSIPGARFIEFLQNDAARAIFEDAGFRVLRTTKEEDADADA